ncbi:MAG: ABC transporter ATP-binding protein/permease [Elainellaceae cyanobacterium]
MTLLERPQGRFRFDKQLLHRFIEIAQPYFYPTDGRGTGTFLGLLTAMLVLVVAAMFFIVVGLTRLGQLVASEFFTQIAAQLVERVDVLLRSATLPLAIAAMVASLGLFFVQHRVIRQRWRQWFMLTLLLFLAFMVNGINVTLSYTFRIIDNALNQREAPLFWQFLFIYAGIILLAVPVIALYQYARLKLALHWRAWLTRLFLQRYFHDRAYYDLDSNAVNTRIDNPDQRITEDIKAFTEVTLSFLLDILDSVLALISFTAVLYSISKVLTLGLLVYAGLGAAIAILVGQRLIRINYDQLRLEANFRYGMVHVRDNAESIAFYQGERLEQQQVDDRLRSVLHNSNLLILWNSIIVLLQRGYNYFTRIVPYTIVAPLYLMGETDFGTIGQASLAFRLILDALSVITNRIEEIAKFAASITRLGAFYECLDSQVRVSSYPSASGTPRQARPRPDALPPDALSPNALSPDVRPKSSIQTRLAPALSIENLTLRTPNAEQTLIEQLTLGTDVSDRLLVVGASGCGKSSLLRAIAGLWTNGDGIIFRPEVTGMLFLPQQPYLLLGTLRDQLVYPNSPATIADDEIHRTLEQVNLEALPGRVGGLNLERDWPTILSLGEQQRLAFARILLTRPKYAILDEATSALDVKNERHLYRLLTHLKISYLSVGHRPSLVDYHDNVLTLEWRRWRLTEASCYLFEGS